MLKANYEAYSAVCPEYSRPAVRLMNTRTTPAAVRAREEGYRGNERKSKSGKNVTMQNPIAGLFVFLSF